MNGWTLQETHDKLSRTHAFYWQNRPRCQNNNHHIYVIELKLRNNGGKEAAIKQIQDRQYLEPFKADKREVVGLGIELDEEGKGVLDWEMVNEE